METKQRSSENVPVLVCLPTVVLYFRLTIFISELLPRPQFTFNSELFLLAIVLHTVVVFTHNALCLFDPHQSSIVHSHLPKQCTIGGSEPGSV